MIHCPKRIGLENQRTDGVQPPLLAAVNSVMVKRYGRCKKDTSFSGVVRTHR
jgi:hypothetical protein